MSLGESCASLAGWLPVAAALIAEPDADGVTGTGQPGSRPPWNSAAASAVTDAREGVRRLEASMRLAVTGRAGRARGGSDANTTAAIRAIEALGHGVAPDAAAQAARILGRWSTAIQQLPAVDEIEHPRKIAIPCPYCAFSMMRLYPRAGRVTCLRYGACFDRDGKHPTGLVEQSIIGRPVVAWSDGLIQYGAAEESGQPPAADEEKT